MHQNNTFCNFKFLKFKNSINLKISIHFNKILYLLLDHVSVYYILSKPEGINKVRTESSVAFLSYYLSK